MNRLQAILKVIAATGFVFVAATSSPAEEIDKKFRLAFGLDYYDTSGAVHSAAANRRALFLTNGELSDILFDPRNDSGAISNYSIEPQFGGVLAASYAVSRLWYVEASVGYRTGSVGNVQVQAQFTGTQVPTGQSFAFSIFNLDGGTITQVPVEFTTGIRFRPKATFNPYLCVGVGYTFMSYSPSDDIDQLSTNLGKSVGGFSTISGSLFGGGEGFNPITSSSSLGGITVEVEDAPEWHFGGGFEFLVKSGWSLFLDARYYTYSGSFNMLVDGAADLGVSVPNDQAVVTDPGAFGPFGSILITSGGLIDGGSFIPEPLAPPGTNCAANGNINCVFDGPPDGVPDPGYYYVEAGDIRFNGISFQFGVKYTF